MLSNLDTAEKTPRFHKKVKKENGMTHDPLGIDTADGKQGLGFEGNSITTNNKVQWSLGRVAVAEQDLLFHLIRRILVGEIVAIS